jgi:negative regulator of sigma E activity
MSVDWEYTREWLATLAEIALGATAIVAGVLGVRKAIEETRKAAAEADKARCDACQRCAVSDDTDGESDE